MEKSNQSRMNEILQSLDGISRAEAPAFLATRVRARLQDVDPKSLSIWDRTGNWLTRPGVFASLLVVILAVNAGLVWSKLPAEPSNYTVGTNAAEEETDAFAVSDSNSPLLP